MMARTEKIRASPFTSEELEVLVDGVLAQYPRLYGGPNVVLKVHQRKAVWRAIATEVRALGVSNRRRTHCHKRWDDISRLAKQVAEMTMGLIPRTGRLARRSFTPLMARILAVTHPELDAQLKEHQRQEQQGTPVVTEEQETETSGGETSTAAEQVASDTDVSGPSEGDRSMLEESIPETQSTSSSDATVDASILGATGNGESATSSTTQRPVPSLPSTSSSAARARRKGRVTFGSGTAAPAHVPPAAMSAESVELLRQLCVGQTALLNAFIEHDKKLGQVLAFMEGIHSEVGGLNRNVHALSSTVTSALQQASHHESTQMSMSSTRSLATSEDSDHGSQASQTRYDTRSTQKKQPKRVRTQTPSPQESMAQTSPKDRGTSGKSKGGRQKVASSVSHGSESSPAKGPHVPDTAHKAKHPDPLQTEEVLSGKGTPRMASEPLSPTTSTPIPSPVKQGKEFSVEGAPVQKGKGSQKRSRTRRPAASSTSPEGVSVSEPAAAPFVCVPVVSHPVPINPYTGKPFRIPKKWKGTPQTSPTHPGAGGDMSPPPRATLPPGPHSPQSCHATAGPASPVPLPPQSCGPADSESQQAAGTQDSPV